MLGKNGITNAVCHRNYAISGEHTKIFIFDDRMEIVSPGKLPSIITIDNMKNERYARNPQISRVLTELGLVKELNVLEQKVLQYIYDKGEVTNKEICEYIDRTRRTTIRILNRLEEKNLIEWIGTSVSDPKKVYTVKQKNEKMSQ